MTVARSLYPSLLESLETFAVVGLVGPRQVGKTWLAKQLSADLSAMGKSPLMLDLERPSDWVRINVMWASSLSQRQREQNPIGTPL